MRECHRMANHTVRLRPLDKAGLALRLVCGNPISIVQPDYWMKGDGVIEKVMGQATVGRE